MNERETSADTGTEPLLPRWFLGGCHCGGSRFRVMVRRFEALDCNCSVCSKKGFLHLIVPELDFEALQGHEQLSTYRFNTGTALHMFCPTCGIHPYYRPRSHPDHWDINVRCLDHFAVDHFAIKPFDGRNWESNAPAIQAQSDRNKGAST
ncbi:MAG: GFA family protein [Polyangiaceae bacterium]